VFVIDNFRETIKEKISCPGFTGKDIIKEFQNAMRNCKKQSTLIRRAKQKKFDYFKKRYYAEETKNHTEFKLRKRRLYRSMDQLNKLLRLPKEEWIVVSTYIYEKCGKEARIPLSVTF